MSGPAGVGKSTTSRALVHALKNSAYISGDDVSHMHVKGRRKPWESKRETALIWNNIGSLTRNFIREGIDVVIDYVAFPDEAYRLQEQLSDLNARFIYVVLWTDPATLLHRDRLREPQHRMGERSLVLLEEFRASGLSSRHMLDTSGQGSEAMTETIDKIMQDRRFALGEEHV
ncbi:AAA family ATPase [Paenibacillus sp. SYP-B4298]|uniref:AAA family ATPase n=1 Tax=Paenibacillus sp. SYP-B4298 TaxID=2996034 RepID=UPI0022DDA0FA|nr:AAA family ATPase [Paenibacillus sp. SYP-B4298]